MQNVHVQKKTNQTLLLYRTNLMILFSLEQIWFRNVL